MMADGGLPLAREAAEKTLVVEGWRFLPHSYAVVNQFQLLALMRQPGLRLYHRDLPYYQQHWKRVSGLLPRADEKALENLPGPSGTGCPEALYRIGFPYDLAQGRAERTFVFGTSELQWVSGAMLARPGSLGDQMGGCGTVIVTPSRWSREGFIRSGAPAERVRVVSHGVDPALYRPLGKGGRAALRKKLGWEGHFVFLSVGTMRSAKGTRLMLKALAALAPKHPRLRLALKGGDALYDSAQLVEQMADTLTETEKAIVLERIFYLGEPLSFSAMAQLYQAADVYLTPYLAEGFNLPALEAAACGLPVICTRGGPTDDFAHPDYFLGIHSRLGKKAVDGGGIHLFLVPDLDHLVVQMERAIHDDQLRQAARRALPAWIARRFSWAAVTGQLLRQIFHGDDAFNPQEAIYGDP